MSVVTTSASIFGYTPNYAPLEQVQGLGTDPRSDIYALAATLFHLMTNVKPPDALSRASAIVNGLPDPLPLANEVTAQVGPAVAAVLSKGMSQKRDDRFASANEMRDAFRIAAEHPLGEAATVLIAGAATNAGAGTVTSEASTKLVGDQTTPLTSPLGSEARTLVAADATKVRDSTSTGETATLVQTAPRGKSSRTWLGAVLLLILIAGGAGAFYAYRARKQTQPDPSTATSSPAQLESAQPSSTQPANSSQVTTGQTDPAKASEPKSEKKVSTSQRTATSKPPAETPEPQAPAKQLPNLPPTAHDSGRHPDRNSNPDTAPSPQPAAPFDPFRNRGRPHPPGGGQMPSIRTLPDGTRIVTQPDGTRIITGPKGRVRVIPPGENPNRRRERP
jgi:serine/threonine protein kinase